LDESFLGASPFESRTRNFARSRAMSSNESRRWSRVPPPKNPTDAIRRSAVTMTARP